MDPRSVSRSWCLRQRTPSRRRRMRLISENGPPRYRDPPAQQPSVHQASSEPLFSRRRLQALHHRRAPSARVALCSGEGNDLRAFQLSVRRRFRPAPGRSPSPSIPSALKRCMRSRTVCAHGTVAWPRSHSRTQTLPAKDDHPGTHYPVCRGVRASRKLADYFPLFFGALRKPRRNVWDA